MKDDIVIRVNDVKKGFKIYYDRSKTLKDILSMPGKGHHEMREVLKGVSFQVKRGEALAIIGKNGCGKSTMLKLLTRIMYPDSGEISVKGKVSSLLELGAGFHPDMSGRENIYLNASVFGLTKHETDQKIDEIIRFSELEKFIDNPVRTYSSGMYMRLAFSVAINVRAEVLLIDEILGVGDVSFQKKCFNKLKEIKEGGATIVVVSHSTKQIEEICDRCIWICDGYIKEEGNTKTVNQHYYQYMELERLGQLEQEQKLEQDQIIAAQEENLRTVEENAGVPEFCDDHAIRKGGKDISFSNIELYNQYHEMPDVFHDGDTLLLEMDVVAPTKEQKVNMIISISNDEYTRYFENNFYLENNRLISLPTGECRISFSFRDISLLSGEYYVSVGLYTKKGEILDEIKYAKGFLVRSRHELCECGVFHMDHSWQAQTVKV